MVAFWHRRSAHFFRELIAHHHDGDILISEPDRTVGTVVSLAGGHLGGVNIDFREDEGIPSAVITHDRKTGKKAMLLVKHDINRPEEHTPTWLGTIIGDDKAEAVVKEALKALQTHAPRK